MINDVEFVLQTSEIIKTPKTVHHRYEKTQQPEVEEETNPGHQMP